MLRLAAPKSGGFWALLFLRGFRQVSASPLHMRKLRFDRFSASFFSHVVRRIHLLFRSPT